MFRKDPVVRREHSEDLYLPERTLLIRRESSVDFPVDVETETSPLMDGHWVSGRDRVVVHGPGSPGGTLTPPGRRPPSSICGQELTGEPLSVRGRRGGPHFGSRGHQRVPSVSTSVGVVSPGGPDSVTPWSRTRRVGNTRGRVLKGRVDVSSPS